MKKPATVFIFVFLGAVFVALLVPKVIQLRQLQERSRKLDVEINKLQKENKALENELTLLRVDPVYLEKVAREKFNKAKQGEIVYKVVRPTERT